MLPPVQRGTPAAEAWLATSSTSGNRQPPESEDERAEPTSADWPVPSLGLPQHFLCFLPLPHGHGSFRPTLGVVPGTTRRGPAPRAAKVFPGGGQRGNVRHGGPNRGAYRPPSSLLPADAHRSCRGGDSSWRGGPQGDPKRGQSPGRRCGPRQSLRNAARHSRIVRGSRRAPRLPRGHSWLPPRVHVAPVRGTRSVARWVHASTASRSGSGYEGARSKEKIDRHRLK